MIKEFEDMNLEYMRDSLICKGKEMEEDIIISCNGKAKYGMSCCGMVIGKYMEDSYVTIF